MLDEPWVPIYLCIIIFFSLVPVVLYCMFLIQFCIFELEERANDIREQHKENMQKFIMGAMATSMLARTPSVAQESPA